MKDIIYLYPLIGSALIQIALIIAAFVAKRGTNTRKLHTIAQTCTAVVAGSSITAMLQVLGLVLINSINH